MRPPLTKSNIADCSDVVSVFDYTNPSEIKLVKRFSAADLGYGHAAPFRYRNRGLSVTLGQHRGTTQVRKLTVTGFVAWWMGRSYHLLMIPGLARRARVVTDWTIALLFPRDVSQLGQLGKPTPLATPSTPSAARQP